jgi:3-oxoacyl-[acyl-carrier-protein] synthase II
VERFADRGFLTNMAALIPDLDIAAGESRAMAMLTRLLAPLAGKLSPMTPVILATTVGEIEYVERAVLEGREEIGTSARPQVLLERVKRMLGLRGRGMVVSSACASSAAALTRAASMIRRREAQSVLVVTCDSVSEFVYSGFTSLLSLCDRPASPFDAERGGLTLGEAAAWTLVSSDETPATPAWSASILGWGNTADAFHMTAPDPSGAGLKRAIAKACAMAGRDANDVSLIAAHGTATLFSDAMEILAFRGAMRGPKPVFSVKGGVGHTLGAAGLVQILVANRAMAQGLVPPTVGMSMPDPGAAGWVDNRPVALSTANGTAHLALSTNSGFGGVNTAVLLEGRAAA